MEGLLFKGVSHLHLQVGKKKGGKEGRKEGKEKRSFFFFPKIFHVGG